MHKTVLACADPGIFAGGGGGGGGAGVQAQLPENSFDNVFFLSSFLVFILFESCT